MHAGQCSGAQLREGLACIEHASLTSSADSDALAVYVQDIGLRFKRGRNGHLWRLRKRCFAGALRFDDNRRLGNDTDCGNKERNKEVHCQFTLKLKPDAVTTRRRSLLCTTDLISGRKLSKKTMICKKEGVEPTTICSTFKTVAFDGIIMRDEVADYQAIASSACSLLTASALRKALITSVLALP